jgi:hypothetical protein
MVKQAKSPRRRFPKRPGQKTGRQWMTIRVGGDMRAALEAAAERSGRSLTQEAELRLELGLRDQRAILDVLDVTVGYQTAGLMRMLGDMQEMNDWINDPGRFERKQHMVALVFEALSPGAPTAEQRERAAAEVFAPGTPEEAVRRYFTSQAFGPRPAPAWKLVSREVWARLGDTAAVRAMMWAKGVKP